MLTFDKKFGKQDMFMFFDYVKISPNRHGTNTYVKLERNLWILIHISNLKIGEAPQSYTLKNYIATITTCNLLKNIRA